MAKSLRWAADRERGTSPARKPAAAALAQRACGRRNDYRELSLCTLVTLPSLGLLLPTKDARF